MTATVTSAASPLSVAQEALWFMHVLAPGRVNYNESIAIHRDGPLDPHALRRAFGELVRRHEAWRTTFDVVAGQAVQIVQPVPSLPVPHFDLSDLDGDEAEHEALRLSGRLARIPYDLRHGPLVRPRLVSFPGDRHRLILAMHHLAFDGVCVSRVVLPELVALYDAVRAGLPSPLADPPAQYGDYARWEQEWIAGPRAARRLEHWRRRLDGAPELPLPLDRPRPAQRRFRGAIVPLTVPSERVRALREVGQSSGATLFQSLAAVWALLLHRFSGQDDVITSTAADLRQRREFEAVVGYCLTPLVLRCDLSGDPSFSELVVRVRNDLLDGLENLVPFERIVRAADPERSRDINPIYRTMLILEPAYLAPDPSWSLHQLASDVDAAVGGSKLDLELQLDERPEGHIQGRLVYDTDLFEATTATRLAGHWLALIDAVLAAPSSRISSLSIDGGAARRGGVVDWGRAVSPGPDRVGQALAAELALGPADTVLALPSESGNSQTFEASIARAVGARVVVAPPEACADGARLSRLMAEEDVTFLSATPATWRALIDTGFKGRRGLRAMSRGGRLTSALAEELRARCHVLWNAFGTPETSGCATLAWLEPGAPVTIGRPIPGAEAYIVDGGCQLAPLGAVGELLIAGSVIAPPPEADRAFIPNPFGDGTAYRTGERARWRADGDLELVPADWLTSPGS